MVVAKKINAAHYALSTLVGDIASAVPANSKLISFFSFAVLQSLIVALIALSED